jgi:hypothetical protein
MSDYRSLQPKGFRSSNRKGEAILKLIPGDQSKTFTVATLAKLSPDAKMPLSAEL